MSKPSPSKPQDPAPANAPSFEDAMAEVEQIIDRIESGEIGLEQAIAQYERGVQLIQHCRTVHKRAVLRVDDLTQKLLSSDPSTPPPTEPAE